LVVLNAINLPDSVANLYFKAPKPDLQTLLYTTEDAGYFYEIRMRLKGQIAHQKWTLGRPPTDNTTR
jgi:hypothetical protein